MLDLGDYLSGLRRPSGRPNLRKTLPYQDFAGSQIEAGKISFEAEITRVSRCNAEQTGAKDAFCLVTSRGNATCQVVPYV